MRTQEIQDWVQSLTNSFGGVRDPVDPTPLLELYRQQDYTGMLGIVRKSLRLEIPLRVGFVNSGGPPKAPAWVQCPVPMPLYGSQEFKSTRITVYMRKSFLEEMPFQGIVCMMAHELSHVVLDGIGHSLRRQEEAVDLTAMILGYRDLYLQKIEKRVVTILEPKPQNWFQKLTKNYPIPGVDITYEEHRIGYLTLEERHFAASLMR